MELIEQKLTELSTDVTAYAAKQQEEIKNIGTAQSETKSALAAALEEIKTLHTQLDAVDSKLQNRHISTSGTVEHKSLGQMFCESEKYLAVKNNGGFDTARQPINVFLPASPFGSMEVKTDITTGAIGGATTGVMVPQRLPGIVGLPEQALRIRDVMTVITQTTGNAFDYVYEATRTDSPSPQVEAGAKSQSYYNWQSASGSIRTIAHFIRISKQALNDVPFLTGTIDHRMTYGLKVKEESQILSGDGTGVNLNGILTQATAYNTAYNVAANGWQRLDQLRMAKLQARLAGLATYTPNAFVLNPTDMAKLELTKNLYGSYIIGDPKGNYNLVTFPMVWNLPVVESDSISAGTFLVGSFNNGAALIDRQATSIEISYEDASNFTTNMATVLCEERIGLAVTKATSFITGTFSTSPATQN